jgi:hypothetical protein
VDLMAPPDGRKFQVQCDAGSQGRFDVGTDTLSVRVGQRMRAGKEQEMWDSVNILCKEQPDGSLTVEVLVSHPDWEEAKTIAAIHSRHREDGAATPRLVCDLRPPEPSGLQRASGAE